MGTWSKLQGGTFLHLGGKLSYNSNEKYLENQIVDENGYLKVAHSVDLTEAIKAEWVLEKI